MMPRMDEKIRFKRVSAHALQSGNEIFHMSDLTGHEKPQAVFLPSTRRPPINPSPKRTGCRNSLNGS